MITGILSDISSEFFYRFLLFKPIYRFHEKDLFPLIKELIQKGVDGIITDRPDLMFEALQELGF